MASTYLNKTFGSVGNRDKWTFSCWIKKCKNGSEQRLLTTSDNATYDDNIRFNSDDTFDVICNGSVVLRPNRKFRDTSAFYNITVVWDSGNATSGERCRLWINGTRETSFSTETYPSQNQDSYINNNTPHYIGVTNVTANSHHFDGVMTHVHFCDGYAYDASYFGETDATTGIWKPKTAPSVSYGTNGFFLKFASSGSMGTDSSGLGNNWTVSGTLTQTQDTPSHVFATWTSAMDYGSSGTFAYGNTQWNSGTATNRFWCTSTLGVSSGKWYVEMKNTVQAAHNLLGIAPRSAPALDWYLGGSGSVANADDDYQWGYKAEDGNIVNNTSATSYGNTYGTSDIIGIALDLDNNKLYFAKNGTWQNSGDPTSGATGTGAVSITAASSNPTGVYHIVGACGTNSGASTFQANFGNGYFGTTAVSSAESDGNGLGLFEYAPPTGYYALCTKNINSQEYA